MKRTLGFCIGFALTLPACSFVIDFDELERGRTTQAPDAGHGAQNEHQDAAIRKPDGGDASSEP